MSDFLPPDVTFKYPETFDSEIPIPDESVNGPQIIAGYTHKAENHDETTYLISITVSLIYNTRIC